MGVSAWGAVVLVARGARLACEAVVSKAKNVRQTPLHPRSIPRPRLPLVRPWMDNSHEKAQTDERPGTLLSLLTTASQARHAPRATHALLSPLFSITNHLSPFTLHLSRHRRCLHLRFAVL